MLVCVMNECERGASECYMQTQTDVSKENISIKTINKLYERTHEFNEEVERWERVVKYLKRVLSHIWCINRRDS